MTTKRHQKQEMAAGIGCLVVGIVIAIIWYVVPRTHDCVLVFGTNRTTGEYGAFVKNNTKKAMRVTVGKRMSLSTQTEPITRDLPPGGLKWLGVETRNPPRDSPRTAKAVHFYYDIIECVPQSTEGENGEGTKRVEKGKA